MTSRVARTARYVGLLNVLNVIGAADPNVDLHVKRKTLPQWCKNLNEDFLQGIALGVVRVEGAILVVSPNEEGVKLSAESMAIRWDHIRWCARNEYCGRVNIEPLTQKYVPTLARLLSDGVFEQMNDRMGYVCHSAVEMLKDVRVGRKWDREKVPAVGAVIVGAESSPDDGEVEQLKRPVRKKIDTRYGQHIPPSGPVWEAWLERQRALPDFWDRHERGLE